MMGLEVQFGISLLFKSSARRLAIIFLWLPNVRFSIKKFPQRQYRSHLVFLYSAFNQQFHPFLDCCHWPRFCWNRKGKAPQSNPHHCTSPLRTRYPFCLAYWPLQRFYLSKWCTYSHRYHFTGKLSTGRRTLQTFPVGRTPFLLGGLVVWSNAGVRAIYP
jgi:hypothetical protein